VIQHRGTPRPAAFTIASIVAALAIGTPAPTLAQELVPGAQRETAMAEEHQTRTVLPSKGPKLKGPAPKAWTFYRNLATDPQGRIRSYDRLRRLVLLQLFRREAAARSWKKLERQIRREAPAVARMPVPTLITFAEQYLYGQGVGLEL